MVRNPCPMSRIRCPEVDGPGQTGVNECCRDLSPFIISHAPIALQSGRKSMKKKLARTMLAAAILVPPASLASQSAQQDSSQTRSAQVTPSTPDRKPQKVYHIGGDVKAPRVISSFQPSLDEEQIRQLSAGKKVAKTGSTVVGIIVGEDGTVRSAKVLESFNRDLDAKAIDAVKKWKFEPALKKGVPVAVELSIHVDFHLYK